jgi:glutaredoxin-related protein
MKGTPETPQCGFSRASIQILGLQGVDPNKFTAFNVLEDPELRQGTVHQFLCPSPIMPTVAVPIPIPLFYFALNRLIGR